MRVSGQKWNGFQQGIGVVEWEPHALSQQLGSRHADQDQLLSSAFCHRTPRDGILLEAQDVNSKGKPALAKWSGSPEPQPHASLIPSLSPEIRNPQETVQSIVFKSD